MRVAIYDKNPGYGLWQHFLALTWRIGCCIHWVFGKLDAYYGASSWDDAFKWLESRPGMLTSVQYWGHGSPGTAWLAGKPIDVTQFKRIQHKVVPATVLWFRTCSTFQGESGHTVSKYLTNLLGCTVAAHTRIIGVFQGGLHTRRPGEEPSWPVTEGEFPNSKLAQLGLKWGNNTVLCLAARIPKGW
jgi:hypothetical protein